MSKDFDSERVAEIDASAREFTIGGEQFTIRVATAPEVYVRYWDALRDSSSADGNLTNTEFLAVLDDTVVALIEPGETDRWRHVRENADPPVTIRAISQVVDYCMGVQSGRPPTQASSSSNGSADATSGPPSTDESDLREVQGSPA